MRMTHPFCARLVALLAILTSHLGQAEMPGVDGQWKLPSEYPGRYTYFFKVNDGQSHLTYPPEERFLGIVPHAANHFKAGEAGEFILSPNVRVGKGTQNWFALLQANTGNKDLEPLAQNGLRYKRDSDGRLVPEVADSLKVWLPSVLPAKPGEETAAKAAGDAFDRFASQPLQMSFPKDEEATAPCPEGMKQLVKFSPEAFDEARKISRFQMVPKGLAQVHEGTSKHKLMVMAIPGEEALSFAFISNNKLAVPLLKMYRVSGDEWIVPNGKVDPQSHRLLCQVVRVKSAPIAGGADPAAASDSSQPR